MPSINLDALSINFDDDEPDPNPEATKRFTRILYLAFGCIILVEILVVGILLYLSAKNKPGKPTKPQKTMIVLGSGGHTAEMLKLLDSMDMKRYSPRVYVVAETDQMSGRKAYEKEKALQADGKPKDFDLYAIPRSREVGQSYITSVFSTFKSLLHSAGIVWQQAPDLILVNGPGTCIPICFAAFVFRCIQAQSARIVYVESIARTHKFSLSAKILYHLRIADALFVQWEDLVEKYPRATYAGRLY